MCQRSVHLNIPSSNTIDITFTDINYVVKVGFRGDTKTILKGVSGKFKAGELTAIMGPSGAGKSSLLNILTGLEKHKFSGKVSYMSGAVEESWNVYKKQACYIQQNDQLYPFFSVDEVMKIAADLKLGQSLNNKGKQMIIDDVLETLDLTSTKNTRCDRLSGGQRKRLSIALELIDNPPIVFLDEPTTGLDTLASMKCISLLKNLVGAGRTIVCTIHQPSAAIYDMFDHVYMLASGRCMYQGAAFNTIPYLSSFGFHCPKYHNPADYVIEVISGEYGDFEKQLAVAVKNSCWRTGNSMKKFEKNIELIDENKTTVLVNSPSEIYQFAILMKRCCLILYRDWTVSHLKLLIHFLVGVLLGLTYRNAGSDGSKSISNIGYLITSSVYLCYTSVMPAVLKFPTELEILKKEHFNNWYKLRTYYAAFTLTNLPIQALFAIVYCSASYYLSGQPLEWFRFWMFLSCAILTTFVAESFGLLIGTTMDSINGPFLGAVSVCSMVIFAGYIITFSHMNRFWYMVSHLSYLRYSLEGMVSAVYGYDRKKLPCPQNYCHYKVPRTLINELGMSAEGFWTDVTVLAVNTVILQSIAFCALKRKISRH